MQPASPNPPAPPASNYGHPFHWQQRTDEEIVAFLQERGGDGLRRGEAWEVLVRRWQGRLYAFARSLTRNPAQSEDIVQETFLALWNTVSRKETSFTSLKGWLFRLVSRKAMRLVLARRRSVDLEGQDGEGEVFVSTAAGSERQSVDRELKESLYRLMDDLPDRLRMPILLHFGSNLSQQEIASLVGCGQSTVSDRITDGLAKLKQGMSRLGFSSLPAALPILLSEVIALPPVCAPGVADLAALQRIAAEGQGYAAGAPPMLAGAGAKVVLPLAAVLALGAWGIWAAWSPALVAPPAPGGGGIAPVAALGLAEPFPARRWDFDGQPPANLPEAFFPEQFFEDGSNTRYAASELFRSQLPGVRWLPEGGLSGGALMLDRCRGIVFPVDVARQPVAISFELGNYRNMACGLLAWPEQRCLTPREMRQFKVPLRDPDKRVHPDWAPLCHYYWPTAQGLCWARFAQGELQGYSLHPPRAGVEIRPYLAGLDLKLDNLEIRALTPEEAVRMESLREHLPSAGALPDEGAASTALPPWTPFNPARVDTPGRVQGHWATRQTPEGFEVRYRPATAGNHWLDYCYLGENRSEPFEAEAILLPESGKAMQALNFGICHPNRINYSGTTWSLRTDCGPLLLHLQVYFTPRGCLYNATLSSFTRPLAYTGGSPWLPSPWRREPDARQSGDRFGWLCFEGMRSCGFALAADDQLRLIRLRIRPLSRQALRLPLLDEDLQAAPSREQ